jgi:hypothetical protein
VSVRELIGRLEVVDDDAASALRVISHFDHLVEERAPASAFLRAAAVLAACPAGFHDAARGITRRVDAAGSPLPGDAGPSWPRTGIDAASGSFVWLERPGAPGPLDQLILERCARGLQTLGSGAPADAVAAAVRIACDTDVAVAERREATARLGLSGPVTVVITADDAQSRQALPARRCAVVEGRRTVLLPGVARLSADIRIGVAVAADPSAIPEAAAHARLAFRVSESPGWPSGGVVRYHDLGALAAVVERFPPVVAAEVPDVQALDALLERHRWVIDTLQALLDTASLRQAAAAIHVHHSTLSDRLRWLESRLGYAPTSAIGRQRTAVAVLLWRIAHGPDA